MLVSFFSSNIPLYIGKNLVEKLRKVLEMELETYTPVRLKFVFEKIKFKALHFIQHDFIREKLSSSVKKRQRNEKYQHHRHIGLSLLIISSLEKRTLFYLILTLERELSRLKIFISGYFCQHREVEKKLNLGVKILTPNSSNRCHF